MAVHPETSHRAMQRGLPDNNPSTHNARAVETYETDIFPGHRSTNSTVMPDQLLARPSRSFDTSITLTGHSGSMNYAPQPYSLSTASQPRSSNRSGSSSSAFCLARTAQGVRPSSKAWVSYRKNSAGPNDSSHQTRVTTILRPASDSTTIEIHHIGVNTSMEDICHCLRSSMRPKHDFIVVKSYAGKGKGKAQASIEFRNPSLAEQAMRELQDTKVVGMVIDVIHEGIHSHDYQSGHSSDRKAKKGPIIIDGSRTD